MHHIDRGYPDFVADLQRLGAAVKRIPAPPEPVFPALAPREPRPDSSPVSSPENSDRSPVSSRKLRMLTGEVVEVSLRRSRRRPGGPGVTSAVNTSTRCRPSRPTVVVARMPALASTARIRSTSAVESARAASATG